MSGDLELPALDRDMSTASDEQLIRVVGLIDTLDRRGAVDELLEPVRDRLALLRPARPLTLGRVLILPFEDVLVPAHEVWPGRLCFPRSQLPALIAEVTSALPAATMAKLRARAAGHSMMSAEIVQGIGATLWPAAADIIGAMVRQGSLPPDMVGPLTGMFPLLALAPTLVPTMWELPPRPMGHLSRPALELLLEPLRLAVPLGEGALLSVIELYLLRAASPLVILEPLRLAEFGPSARERESLLGQVVRRRIADMREVAARLDSTTSSGGRPDAGLLLRLVADLEALDGKWPVSPTDKITLATIRRTVSAFVGAGIETAVRGEILGQFGSLGDPGSLSDEGVEKLEATARHTRRLGIAGARLGLGTTPDALLTPFLQPFRDAIRHGDAVLSGKSSGLLDQIRIVEILFGAEVAMRLYDEQRGQRTTASAR
jgi:hypothetical protein